MFRAAGADFSANDRQVLASFADQAAIAVRNAYLYEEVWADKLLLDAIVDSSANGLMILDTSCHVVKINRALGRMTGYSAEEAAGRPCEEVLRLRGRGGDVDICGEQCPLEELSPGEKKRVEGILQGQGNAAPLTVEVTYTPLYDRRGQISSTSWRTSTTSRGSGRPRS